MRRRIVSFCMVCLLICVANFHSVEAATQKLPVFLYHHILPEADNKLFTDNGCVISLEMFKEHMQFLSENGYHTVTVQELNDFLFEKKDLPDKSVMLTFDDGYLSNYEFVYPVLKEYGFTACLFVITGLVEQENQGYDPDLLQFMSWEQIGQANDVFEYASHTDSLHVLDKEERSLLVTQSPAEVRDDLHKSLQLVSGQSFFAYPYGQYDSETIQRLKEMDFRMAVTTQRGYVTQDSPPFELKRIIVFPSFTLEVFKKAAEMR